MKTILIVDDENSILELISEEFADHSSYAIYLARSGDEAIKSIYNYFPDLLILDVQLPCMNGYQICRQVKTDVLTSNTKVIMMSGMTQPPDRQKAYEAGADHFIDKPFITSDLFKIANELLGERI